MASISTAFALLPLHRHSHQHRKGRELRGFSFVFRFGCPSLKWSCRRSGRGFYARAVRVSESSSAKRGGTQDGMEDSGERSGGVLGTVNALPPLLLTMKRSISSNFAVGALLIVVLVTMCIREISKRQRYNEHGSVADLVKRGQLRSDRRGISRPLKYDDPFNNPLVKVSKGNSTVEMCGKVYRLAAVTLTEEQQSSHQKRRSRAYQWKRPTVFLKEGDPVPANVDPDTIRWIPANHPFATTVSDIDEDLAQNNVFQKDGIPFRIKAEHEALQRKLEALQGEQKFNKIAIDPSNVRDFERPFRSFSKPQEEAEQQNSSVNHQSSLPNTLKSDRVPDSVANSSTGEDLQTQ